MGTRCSVPAFKSRTTTSPAARSSGPTMTARGAPRAAASSSCLRMAAGRRPYSTATPRSRSWCASFSTGATSSPLTAIKKASSFVDGRAALLQKLSQDDVSHAEPEGGEIGAAERLQQPVVAAAAAHGPQRLTGVEQLEDNPGVVSEPADDREIDRDEVPQSHGLQGPDGLAQRLPRLLPALHLAKRGQDGVEPAQRRDLEHRVRFPFPDARLPQLGRQHVLRVTLTLV